MNIFPLELSIQALTVIALIIAVVCIISASILLIITKKYNCPWVDLPHHILRDVGIAFLVAALVTFLYGHVLDFQRFSDAVSLIMRENVPSSVWDKTKTEIYKRDVLRGNYEATWNVSSDDSLPNQAILKMRVKYTLYGLKSQPFDYVVEQELENTHLSDTNKNLPRFDRVTVAGIKEYKGPELEQLVHNGDLRLPKIPLNEWKKADSESELHINKGVDIIFERTEIINVPGTYSVVLSELTKNVTLQIDSTSDIQHELKRWIETNSKGFNRTGNYYNYSGVVLPGQSISVQFWRSKDEETPAN